MSATTPTAKPAKVPPYRRQKRKGKADSAFVEIDGVRRYLGEYGTADSKQKHQAVLAEWQAAGWIPPADVHDIAVVMLVDYYWTFAQGHYRKPDGTPTTELPLIKRALGMLVDLYGNLPAKEFSPLTLKAVRDRMTRKGWCRKVVNDMVHRVKRMFRWATENELVPATILHALQAVAGLKHGRSDARESDPVVPVPEGFRPVAGCRCGAAARRSDP